jgi:hypothetical protein
LLCRDKDAALTVATSFMRVISTQLQTTIREFDFDFLTEPGSIIAKDIIGQWLPVERGVSLTNQLFVPTVYALKAYSAYEPHHFSINFWNANVFKKPSKTFCNLFRNISLLFGLCRRHPPFVRQRAHC